MQALSGPLFQRPGTTLFTAAELQPQVNRLYGHLPAARRKDLVGQLVRPDHGGKDDQQGQRVVTVRGGPFSFPDPHTLAEVSASSTE